MIQPIKILIIEEDMRIASTISLQLLELGYEVSAILSRGKDALNFMVNNRPDIALIDLHLKGDVDAVETAQKLQQMHKDIAVIYLTSNASEAHWNRAEAENQHIFISRSSNREELQHSIEQSLNQLACRIHVPRPEQKLSNTNFVSRECLFIRHQESLVKVDINAICYIEANRNYCRIYSTQKEYLLVNSLKNMDTKLPDTHFFRIHRSYIINLSRIDEIGGSHVVIARKAIPMAKNLRPALLSRLQSI
ncbi:LytR/AlgR family response regulator transcription factor [Salegentibacter sp. HM20]